MSDKPIKKRWYAEYALMRIVAAISKALPYRGSLLFAWLLSCIFYPFAASRVREAHRRIKSVFGESIDSNRVKQIARTSFRNTFFSAIEMLRFPVFKKSLAQEIFNFDEAFQTLLDHAATGKGAVLAVPHCGSWEMAGVAAHLSGVPIFNFAGQQRNPFVNSYMNYLRSSPGIDFVPRGSSVYRQAIRLLQSGRFCAIMPDVRMRNGGIQVEFLGGTANIGTGPAFFARMSDVPVFPCIVTRIGWSKHKILVHPPVYPDKRLDKTADVERITRILLKIMDEAVRQQPEQWFWYNKRWILDPIDA